jgi:hypothetical protein
MTSLIFCGAKLKPARPPTQAGNEIALDGFVSLRLTN